MKIKNVVRNMKMSQQDTNIWRIKKFLKNTKTKMFENVKNTFQCVKNKIDWYGIQ